MLTVFAGYVSFIIGKYGILPSISESYYRLPKNLTFLFTLFCWGFALPAAIVGLDLTDNFLMFFAGGGIMFVGAAAAFKEQFTKRVHFIGAAIGITAAQLSTAFDFHMYYINVIFVVLALTILLGKYLGKIKNYVWWIEMVAFLSICYVLGYQLY
jgi:hypothetical protein